MFKRSQTAEYSESRIQNSSLTPTGFRLPTVPKSHLASWTSSRDWAVDFGFWILPRGFLQHRFGAGWHIHCAVYNTLSRRWAAQPHQLVRICDDLFILCGERRTALTHDQRMSRTRTNGRDASTTRMQRAGRCYSDRAAAMCHAPRRVCTWTCPTRCAPTACMFVCLVCLVARCLRAVQHESSYSCERSERAAASSQLVQP